MLRAAVVGAGAMAREHARGLAEVPQATLAAVCDRSRVRAEAFADEFAVPAWHTDVAEMLDAVRPDVVHVVTPAPTHRAIAAMALEAGAHVLVEKPICPDLDQLRALRALADRTGKALLEDHNYLFNAQTRRLVALRDSGALGEVRRVEVVFAVDLLGAGSPFVDRGAPHPALALPGGIASEFVTHMAYLALAFLGPHDAVQAAWDRAPGGQPGAVLSALVQGRHGHAVLGFDAACAPPQFTVRVLGTRMRAELDLLEPYVATAVAAEPGARYPLVAMRNALGQSTQHAAAAVRGLWGRLGGRRGPYHGLTELMRESYAALDAGRDPPLTARWIDDVNRLVADLLATWPSS
ncbi:MAG: Gfo/Idh/MocA family oxidoreductase [Ectothiorhodospiraceae bacterium]|nr:Gfo/Idh/MocA family oxidoreductase [Ectothiorhodospiraceae bacterium]